MSIFCRVSPSPIFFFFMVDLALWGTSLFCIHLSIIFQCFTTINLREINKCSWRFDCDYIGSAFHSLNKAGRVRVSGTEPASSREALSLHFWVKMKMLLQWWTVALSWPPCPGEPGLAVSLVWAVLLMPDPFLSNDSAQETMPQGSDFPHLSLWLLGLEPVPFPKCLLV